MNEEIARGMVCFFHQKKHFYLIYLFMLTKNGLGYTLGDFFTNPSGHPVWEYAELFSPFELGGSART
jgi:hypothetical protein